MQQPNIPNFLIVLSTCADEEEARCIARSAVEKRLAACVNILPGIQSIFRWQGELDSAGELLLLMKTTSERFPALRDHIVSLHSYEVPEIIALPIIQGFEKYLQWIDDSVV